MVVGYLRISTLHGHQANGLDSQRKAIKGYAESHKMGDIEFIADEGVSGAKTSRKGLDQMLELCRSKKVTAIIVYSFSRVSRSLRHLIELVEFFNGNNIAFISLTEGVSSNNPTGKFFISLMGALAELERELVSERVKNGMKAARARGSKIGAPKRRNSKLIWELRNKGYKLKDIASLSGSSISTVSRELSSKKNNKDFHNPSVESYE